MGILLYLPNKIGSSALHFFKTLSPSPAPIVLTLRNIHTKIIVVLFYSLNRGYFMALDFVYHYFLQPYYDDELLLCDEKAIASKLFCCRSSEIGRTEMIAKMTT